MRVLTHADPHATMAHDQADEIDDEVLEAVGENCQDLAEIRVMNCTKVPSQSAPVSLVCRRAMSVCVNGVILLNSQTRGVANTFVKNDETHAFTEVPCCPALHFRDISTLFGTTR